MSVYSYTRVSTARQSEEGESLAAQQSRLDAYATAVIGATVDERFVEKGVSGSVRFGDRPEGARLLATVKPGDVVVAVKLDRCFRSALDALDQLSKFQAMGVKLFLIDMGGDVTGTGIARMVFTILSAVAEAERDRIRERIVDVKAHQRSQGRYLGGRVPFGWIVVDGDLVEEASQQQALENMRKWRDEGMAFRKIADRLAVDGHRIGHVTIKEILDRQAVN